MWLYTIHGFYSVVQKAGEKELTIRARVKADLEQLRNHYLPTLSVTVETPESDYPFRANTTHVAFADALYHIAQDIEYSNFKDAVANQQGYEREKIYHFVWGATQSLDNLRSEDSDDGVVIPRISGLSVTQRLMMRALYHIHLYEPMRTWRSMPFYATAEKLGLVERENNQNNISPEEYAKALVNDGLNKGWLEKPLTREEWHLVLEVFVYRFLKDTATFRGGEPWINGADSL